MTTRIKPVLRYAGAKWSLAPWIISHMPTHQAYVEPFCGSCAVLLAKSPVAHELVSDRAGEIVTLFRVIRDEPEALASALALTPYSREEYELSYTITGDLDPVERARRFMVRVWMSHAGKLGSRAWWRMWRDPKSAASNDMPTLWRGLPQRVWEVVDRLRDVHIECRDFLEVLPHYRSQREALIYVDPPYVASTLGSDRFYLHDYDDRLTRWHRADASVQVYRGAHRVESLWLNDVAMRRGRQLPLTTSASGS